MLLQLTFTNALVLLFLEIFKISGKAIREMNKGMD
jgi:hypothetical protein